MTNTNGKKNNQAEARQRNDEANFMKSFNSNKKSYKLGQL